MTSLETDLSRNFDGAPFFSPFFLFSFFLFLVGCYCKLSSNERVYIYSYYRTNYIIRIYIFYEEKYTLSGSPSAFVHLATASRNVVFTRFLLRGRHSATFSSGTDAHGIARTATHFLI